MKTYKEFHGDILINDIGKRLREIIKKENKSFKILTGYGSSIGMSQSKKAALKSLMKMKKEGLIKGYFPGEVKFQLLAPDSIYFNDKLEYSNIVKMILIMEMKELSLFLCNKLGYILKMYFSFYLKIISIK